MRQAMGQMDDVLADLASFAAGRSTEAQILSDTQVRVSRVIRGSAEQVWAAHHDADLLQRWMLGPGRLDDAGVRGGHPGGSARIATSGSRSVAPSDSGSPASCSRARLRAGPSPPSR